MRDNGTDRDVAMLILNGLTSCKNLIASINDNLYVPHIVTQPTNQTVALNETATFSVVANNAVSYQWQYATGMAPDTWNNSTGPGATTDTYTVTPTIDAHYNNVYRCQITGKDGSVIYTNTVQALRPDT